MITTDSEETEDEDILFESVKKGRRLNGAAKGDLVSFRNEGFPRIRIRIKMKRTPNTAINTYLVAVD